jgi:hypothetical protein
VIQKYLAAIVPILTAAVVFLQSAFVDELDAAEVAQLVAIVAGAFITYLVPLLSGRWAGALKTGAAILAAAATAIAPFVLQGRVTADQWMVVAFAVLSALGVEVGVQARRSIIDARDQGAAVPPVVTTAFAVDPEGVRALRR